MTYQLLAHSGRIEKDLHKIIEIFTDEQRTKIKQTLSQDPKGTSTTHWAIKKVRKDIWQLDLPRGYRIEYTVLDTEEIVLIRFIGTHDDAAVFLRGKK